MSLESNKEIGAVGARTMHAIVRDWAERTPEAPVLLEEGRSPLTYRALSNLIDRLQRSLCAHGFGRNDRIAVIHSGGAAMAATIIGIWSCAAAVPMNPDHTVGEFAMYFRDLGVSAVLVDATLDTAARQAAQRLNLPIVDVGQEDDDMAGQVAFYQVPLGDIGTPCPAGLDDLATVLATSGTTSHSKTVPLRHRELWHKYANAVRSLELTQDDRCLNLMPLFHGHGINTGLGICLWSGGSTVMLPRFDVEEFAHLVETLKPTWYTGSFTFHHQILAHAERLKPVIGGSTIQFARSGSGRLEAQVGRDLEEALDVPIIQTYSTTETGMIASNPRPPRTRKHGSVGLASSNGVAIMGANGSLAAAGELGEVVVRGKNVFQGYENDPAANSEAFDGAWFRTGDVGKFDADGYLFLTGRIKEIINRGGEKITPAEIEEVLLTHPDVIAATVFPVPHVTLGEEVAAAVIIEKGVALSDEVLARYLAGKVTRFKVPRRFLFVDSIPKGPSGKIQRRSLAAEFGLDDSNNRASNEPTDSERPPTELEATLQRLWAKTLGLDTIGLHDDFFLMGGDSLQAVDLFLEIENQIGRRLPRAILFEAGTVSNMAALIASDSRSGCIVPIQPEGNRPPFFCIHDQNGHVLNLRDLARHLGTTQPFYGIQSVGLDGEEAPFIRMADMASHYIEEIRKIQPRGPYYIGGYSFGGRVAYAMAQQLRAEGERIALLALLDTYYLAGRKNVGARSWFARHRDRIAKLGPLDMPAYIAQRVRNAWDTLKVSVRSRLAMTVWRLCARRKQSLPRFLRNPAAANDIIRRNDRPEPYSGEAVLFQAELPALRHSDIHAGWRNLVKGGLEIREVSGRHYDFVKEPHVRKLAKELSDCLDERQERFAPATHALAARAGGRA